MVGFTHYEQSPVCRKKIAELLKEMISFKKERNLAQKHDARKLQWKSQFAHLKPAHRAHRPFVAAVTVRITMIEVTDSQIKVWQKSEFHV